MMMKLERKLELLRTTNEPTAIELLQLWAEFAEWIRQPGNDYNGDGASLCNFQVWLDGQLRFAELSFLAEIAPKMGGLP